MKMAKDKKKKAIDSEINKALLDDFDKFDSFVHTRWKEMIFASIGVIVVIAIIYTVYLKKASTLLKAENALAMATTEAELLAAIQNYGDYQATDFARIKLSRIYIEQKEFNKAVALLQSVSKNASAKELKERMIIDQAYVIETSGKLEDALKIFKSVAENSMNSIAIRAEAFYGAGRLSIALNDKSNAQIYLEQVKSLFASEEANNGSLWSNLAQALLSEI